MKKHVYLKKKDNRHKMSHYSFVMINQKSFTMMMNIKIKTERRKFAINLG
jgi:hypothetical protein